jgi:hypothetical protein
MSDLGMAALFTSLAVINLCNIAMLKQRNAKLVAVVKVASAIAVAAAINDLFLRYPVALPIGPMAMLGLNVLACAACVITSFVFVVKSMSRNNSLPS